MSDALSDLVCLLGAAREYSSNTLKQAEYLQTHNVVVLTDRPEMPTNLKQAYSRLREISQTVQQHHIVNQPNAPADITYLLLEVNTLLGLLNQWWPSSSPPRTQD